MNRKEDLPHYEILDQITTPLRSQGRFAANKNLNATVRLSQLDKQDATVPANPDHQGGETSMNVPPDRPTDTSPSMDTSLNGRPTKPTESMNQCLCLTTKPKHLTYPSRHQQTFLSNMTKYHIIYNFYHGYHEKMLNSLFYNNVQSL